MKPIGKKHLVEKHLWLYELYCGCIVDVCGLLPSVPLYLCTCQTKQQPTQQNYADFIRRVKPSYFCSLTALKEVKNTGWH